MNEQSGEAEVFDVNRIRELVELMKEHELSEIDLRATSNQIRLRRGSAQAPMMAAQPMLAPQAYAAPAPAAAAAAPAEAAPSAAAPAAADANTTTIKSPMVGTFYARPKPESPDFVKVGDTVTPETTVCLVEAMKMYTEIPAGVSGKIVEILVQNEDAVDVNKPMFKVATQ